jgi:hypothetical protein
VVIRPTWVARVWAVTKRAVAPDPEGAPDLLGGDADRQHGLAEAGGTDEGQRSRLLHEGRVEVAQDHLPFELGPEAEIELLDRGGEGEAGLAQPPLGLRRGPRGQFLLQKAGEEVGVARLLLGGAVEPGRQHGGGLVQVHGGEQAVRRGHRATSGSASSISTQAS